MRRLAILAALAVAAVIAVALLSGGAGAASSGATIHVIEHATSDTVTDTGKKGDSAGDILTFANDIYDAGNTKKVGTDQGFCIRVVKGKSYECWWTIFLGKGQITVEGPFFDTSESALAVTGGTGAYKSSRGWMELKFHNEAGTEFDFIYHLS